MIINKLNLTNFRSYKKESINLSKKINVFTGDNGAGKTNILEAIYTLAVARSYKAKDEDMINRGSDFFKISANIENKQKEDNLVLVGSKQGKKVFQKKGTMQCTTISAIKKKWHFYIGVEEFIMILKIALAR